MKQITINMNAQTAELFLHIVDRWFRHFYNVYGVRRINSSKNGIRFEITETAWNYIRDGVMHEFVHKTNQSLCYHKQELSLVEAD